MRFPIAPRASTRISLTTLAMTAALGCMPARQPSTDLGQERALLMRIDAEFSRMSVAKGMQAAFAAYLADDAKSFPQGGALLTGRDAIVADMAVPADRPATLSWEPQAAEVSASGELGYTYGRYELNATGADGAKIARHGKYVTVWKRVPGQGWKIALDIGNTSP